MKSILSGAWNHDCAGLKLIAAALLVAAGMVGTISSASAASFYVNDRTDEICSRMSDGNNDNFQDNIYSDNCRVKHVSEINDSLFPIGGTGSMVLNSDGLFLNNKMQINGTFSLNNHKILDLSPGTEDTDGVNVAQLRGVLAGLGGGAGIDANGNILAPSYTIGGTTYNNVGDALKNLDQRVTDNANAIGNANKQIDKASQDINDLNQRVTNVQNNSSPYVDVNSTNGAASATGQGSVAIGGGAQATGKNSVALGEGSVANENDTVSVGSSSLQRRITNVNDGQNPTDAVNKRQLDTLRSDMNAAIGTVARAAYSGVAAATALTMIPDVDPGKTLAIGIGTANFKGYQAGAIGASARVTPNLKLKVGAGMSAAGSTVGGGASYQW